MASNSIAKPSEKVNTQQYKMVIYKKVDEKLTIPLRQVTVHPTFEGITPTGINKQAFNDLAKFLEPESDFCVPIAL